MKILCYLLLLLNPLWVSGQCYPDRHNTSWSDAWVSCETAANPNDNRGQSHWTFYDFGSVYALGEMKMWNLNVPDSRASGVRTFEVDYSLDGQAWIHLGTFDIDQAPGTSTYEGEIITDWDGLQAQYVILTPTSNYGGQCVGFSEVRFGLSDRQNVTAIEYDSPDNCLAVNVYPNPYTDHFTLDVNSECLEVIRYSVTNVLGQEVMARTLPSSENIHKVSVRTDHLPAGNYVLHVRQGENYLARSLVQLGK